MTNKVTNRQIFIILFLVITSAVMSLTHDISRTDVREGWIPIIIGALIFGISSMFVCKLNNMYQDKVLFDYSKEILGKYFSLILIIYLIIYFVIFFVDVCGKYFEFIHIEFFPDTPQLVMLFIGMIVFGYIANKGIAVVIRIAELIIPLVIIFLVTIYILGITQGARQNLFPFYEKDRIKDSLIALKYIIVPYIGMEMLFIIPFSEKNKKSPKTAFFTLLFIGAFYLLVYESSLSILGVNEVQIYDYSGFEALKVVDFPVIERVDILYETIGFATLFIKISFYYLVIIEFLCRLLPKIKRSILVIIIGFVLFILVTLIFIFNAPKIFDLILMITGAISSTLIPITLYIIAKIKNNKKKNEKEVEETA